MCEQLKAVCGKESLNTIASILVNWSKSRRWRLNGVAGTVKLYCPPANITTARIIFFFTGENLNTSHRPENPFLGFLLP
jgi:hypothetical protein